MKIKRTIQFLFQKDLGGGLNKDMQYWRIRISDALLHALVLFGLFAYIPSVFLSIRDNLFVITIVDTLLYAFTFYLAFNRKLKFRFKAVSTILLFMALGVILTAVLGPIGAGSLWLFSTTIIAAFLLGNRGATLAFLGNVLIHLAFYFLLRFDILHWHLFYGIEAEIWIARSANFLLLNLAFVICNAIFLEGFISLMTRAMETRNASIIGLAKLAEHRDTDTGEHLERIQHLVVRLAEKLTENPKYENYITREYINDLRISSTLHDIGKVGIQDAILLKPGALTAGEFEEIKHHPEIGENVIAEIEKHIKGRSFYDLGREIALYHHEKWDGTGYPKGLKGEAIPLSARITAIVDVYDALTSKRPYKDALSHVEAMSVILRGRGTHFDPEMVDTFKTLEFPEKKPPVDTLPLPAG